MKKIVGWETNACAFPKRNVICFVFSEKINASGAHEIMHIISINLWGGSYNWIQEGLTVFSNDNWHGYNLHEICKYLMMNNDLINLKDLTTKFNNFNDLITYPEAGSFVKFLYEEYGLKNMKKLWKNGTNIFPKIIGKDFGAVEREWHNLLIQYELNNIRYKI